MKLRNNKIINRDNFGIEKSKKLIIKLTRCDVNIVKKVFPQKVSNDRCDRGGRVLKIFLERIIIHPQQDSVVISDTRLRKNNHICNETSQININRNTLTRTSLNELRVVLNRCELSDISHSTIEPEVTVVPSNELHVSRERVTTRRSSSSVPQLHVPLTPLPVPVIPNLPSLQQQPRNNVGTLQMPQNPRRRHGEIPKRVTWRLARYVQAQALEIQCEHTFYCGHLRDMCEKCGALFFTAEPRNRQRLRLSCCKNGSYILPPLSSCPPELKRLYISGDERSVEFRNQIRVINSLFAMASFKTSRPNFENEGQGHWCFSVCGQVYHFTEGVPNTQNLQNPKLQHYYFLDVADAIERRRTFTEQRINPDTIDIIERCLRRVNRYIEAYNTIGEILAEERRQGRRDLDDIVIGIVSHPHMNILRRNYNLPESRSEIAAVFRGMEPPFQVDLKLYPKSRPEGLHTELKNLNTMADPMVYPLLFPCGDNGYSTEYKYTNNRTKSVTFREFYRYRIQIRDGFSVLHCGGKLFQQYIVDSWVKVEANMLWYLRQNQDKFRFAEKEVLRRYNESRRVRGEEVTDRVGRACVLPATFYGGERHRLRQYLDAMAVVTRHGKPDLFITFTCNPRWPEITDNLDHHQKWENRPDLVCRVFHCKLLEFMADLTQKQLYGVVLNYHYVIEFQKRGLPHAHIMITFVDDDKLLDADAVDTIICAYIPDRNVQPLLHQRVAEFQIHKPCGSMNPTASCMHNNQCRKYFPKDYAEVTRMREGNNKRPVYKRPRDGRTVIVPGTNIAVTNRRIVSYNPFALAKYSCHINFEAVGSLLSMKYLYKYVSKGPDCVTLVADNPRRDAIGPGRNDGLSTERNDDSNNAQNLRIDEIQNYLDCRYVSSMEAAWRLLEFKMADRSHAVLVLPVHLQGEHMVVYDELNDDDQDIENRLDKPSKLEAWFNLNTSSPEARQYKYVQIPEFYTWDGKLGRWLPRKQISKMIGCIAEVGPSAGQMEKHYLRMLLCHIPGATSFEDLRTVEGELLPTFKAACQRRNYLQNLDEYDLCLSEAVILRHPVKLRRLFGLICCVAIDENLADLPLLWRRYSRYMIEDFVHRGTEIRRSLEMAAQHIQEIINRNKEYTLRDLNINVDDVVLQVENFYATEYVPNDNNRQNDEIVGGTRTTYDPANLNFAQKTAFIKVLGAVCRSLNVAIPENILSAVSIDNDNVSYDNDGNEDNRQSENEEQSIFYLDGPAGTGKTYLYNTLLATIRDVLHKGTVSVAWTGIAANLLIGGTTVHRAFRLPLNLDDEAAAGWPLQHEKSKILRNIALIVWDEAPMTPKTAIEAVDKYLRDLMNNSDQPMGGKVVLFGGDFRQILPVIIGGHRTDVLHSTLKYSRLWPELNKLRLKKNMRVVSDQSSEPLLGHDSFGNWLLQLGEGRLPYVTLPAVPTAPLDLIQIPNCLRASSFEELVSFVYGDDFISEDAGSKAILCPTNVAVDKVNHDILAKIPGEPKTYVSVDNYKINPEDDLRIPLDVLHSVSTPSLPPHELVLKIGAIVMLLRNIDVDDGQCNGTRLRVVGLYDHIIECELISGEKKGMRLWLPKMTLTARDTALPSDLIRIQFPVKLAYAMTINKSQGQTMTKVGVYLNRPCFTHGQLYVAFSRVRQITGLKVFVQDGIHQGSFKFRGRKTFTRNVVYHSVLGDHVDPIPPRQTISADEDDIIHLTEDDEMMGRILDDPWEIIESDSDDDDDNEHNVDNNDNHQPNHRHFPNVVEETTPINDIDRLILPSFTEEELNRRRAIDDRPGTSGMRFPIKAPHNGCFCVPDSDSSDED